jgi:hypothetical protein
MKRDIMILYSIILGLFLFIITYNLPRKVRQREQLSGFQDVRLAPASVGEKPIQYVSGPADSALNARVPYHLLQGVLDDAAVDDQPNTAFNAQACYESDFANRIQLTGNYSQMTNNYRRKNPDSCSAPVHELVNNFYKPSTL